MSTTVDAFNTEDLLDFCVQIMNSEIKQEEEIVVKTPVGVQIWKIVHLDNQSTVGNYEAHITFETPNGVLKVHIHVNKDENQNFIQNFIVDS